eukprot:GEZU01004885.1.p1 GENE.GEZU01004885.1~~GEZU01004885.1.p1  ORF type:complete len:446 (+),score=116.90 GEZU01004885.1:105-1442(+)
MVNSTVVAHKRLSVIESHLSLSECASSPSRSSSSASDYLQLDDLLTPEEIALRYKVREFAEKEIRPVIDAYAERAEFPHFLVPKLAKVVKAGGILKGHGCPGHSLMATAVIALELAKVDASMATFFIVHSDIAMGAIGLCGSEEQKARFLPKMATMECIGSFALTEPDVGSDASSIQTTATKVEGGWLLNGEKRWIGMATHAAYVVVWAKNAETNQVNGFVVETDKAKQRDPNSYVAHKIENKIAMRCVQNAHIILKNCFVPDENRLANAVDFRTGPARVLGISRIHASWLPVGIAMGAYESALQYAKTRRQFGVSLASNQLIQEKLVRVLATIQAMTMLVWRVSKMWEKGSITPGISSMVKAHNTLRGRECVAICREIVGGNGIVTDFGVARHFADMEGVYTYEGAYEINALVTGREVTGISAFKSGGNGDASSSSSSSQRQKK